MSNDHWFYNKQLSFEIAKEISLLSGQREGAAAYVQRGDKRKILSIAVVYRDILETITLDRKCPTTDHALSKLSHSLFATYQERETEKTE